MDALINAATSSYQTTAGFSLDSVAVWMWSNLVEPILGAGLAVIVALRNPIIALVATTLVVFFAFKAWRIWRGQ